MANVVQDPKATSKAIRRGLSPAESARHVQAGGTWIFTYGSKWKQRYWKKQGDDYYSCRAVGRSHR